MSAFSRYQEIVAGISDLTLMPNQQPLRREDLFLFLAKDFSRDKVSLRQGFCPGGEIFSVF